MSTAAIHAFEHLGQAPYRFVGRSERRFSPAPGVPARAGASCDHCGTAIVECFEFESADGRRFKVGNVCVQKSSDRGLIDVVKRAARQAACDKRREGATARTAELRGLLAQPAIQQRLSEHLSPRGFGTALEWADWMLANAGDHGRTEVLRYIRQDAEAR